MAGGFAAALRSPQQGRQPSPGAFRGNGAWRGGMPGEKHGGRPARCPPCRGGCGCACRASPLPWGRCSPDGGQGKGQGDGHMPRWSDTGRKVSVWEASRWDAIDHVRFSDTAGQLAGWISAREARQVALRLHRGPEGTERAQGWTNAQPRTSDTPGIVTVWSAAGVMLEQYRVLRGGKRRHDRAAENRARQATPEALAAARARQATPEARAARAARAATPEARARDAARKAESRREARALDVVHAAEALALLASGGAMRQ